MGRGSEQTVCQRKCTDGRQEYERCSTSLIIREMQIKATMRYQLMPGRMTIIENIRNNWYWREYEDKGTFLHCWWD